jgi:hypothetical protein
MSAWGSITQRLSLLPQSRRETHTQRESDLQLLQNTRRLLTTVQRHSLSFEGCSGTAATEPGDKRGPCPRLYSGNEGWLKE